MIEYKFPEERTILLHYARLLNDSEAEKIINQDGVTNASEAEHLAKFFWRMVDQSVQDIEDGNDAAGHHDLEAWNEYIFESIRAYLRNSGYANEWDKYV